MPRIIGDNYSNHNLPIGANVQLLEARDDVDLYTMGGEGDEVAIDPRDLSLSPGEPEDIHV